MKITIQGVRGSIPTSGPDTKFYGGNTSSIDIVEDGCTLVLDCGTGVRQSNYTNGLSNKRVDILLTHLHLDHLQGLGFFKALFDPSKEVHIWGPASNSESLNSRLGRYLSPPLFPVRIRDLPCKLILHEVENSTFQIGPFTIHSNFVIHPGPTIGYRITGKKSVLAYIPDHEPALGLHGMLNDAKWVSGIDLAVDADLLLHDAQYSSEEYKNRIGWGHSSMEDSLKFATMANVKRFLLFHHDPSHSDDQLNQLFFELTKNKKQGFSVELAKEGVVIDLP
jgi:phosphoribosyl 1,2-cyclic phosphodiesterase